MAEPAGKLFDGTCPFCGLSVNAGLENALVSRTRRCPCGAVAFGAPQFETVVDAMVKHYQICPSNMHGDIHKQSDWLRDFHIETKPGGRGVEPPDAKVVVWQWYKRNLPWERPAGPMSDPERLAWLKSQGEKFYDLMYDSKNPRFEFREAKEAFEDAIVLAHKLNLPDEETTLSKRLAHIKAVFRSQFDI